MVLDGTHMHTQATDIHSTLQATLDGQNLVKECDAALQTLTTLHAKLQAIRSAATTLPSPSCLDAASVQENPPAVTRQVSLQAAGDTAESSAENAVVKPDAAVQATRTAAVPVQKQAQPQQGSVLNMTDAAASGANNTVANDLNVEVMSHTQRSCPPFIAHFMISP